LSQNSQLIADINHVVYQFALMKENVHRGAHALTDLMFAASVIMF